MGAQRTRIYVDSLDAKPGVKTRKEVVAADSNAVYASGYLLFVRERTLMAQPFDASKIQTTGDAVPIAEQVDYFLGASLSHFSVSRNGHAGLYLGSRRRKQRKQKAPYLV